MKICLDAPVSIDEIGPTLFAALPHLRAFAISLAGDPDRADDLVQEAVARALGNIHQFQRGTNLQAWMFTILRNQFHTGFRKRKREVEDADGVHAGRLAVAPSQGAHLEFADVRDALGKLSPEQREAIVLVCAEGMTYEETAAICGAAVGTIKSRVNRARKTLARLLGYDGLEEVGPSGTLLATLNHAESSSARLG